MTLISRVLGSLAKLPPATAGAVSVERDLPARMSDGVALLADRWYPTGAVFEHAPIILLRTPYGRRQWGMIGRLFAERGYQVVLQSCRGTFGSGGDFVPFRSEEADGRATLDWIAGQPWFDGKLATFGPSYLGLTQWAIAHSAPDYLKAVALDVTASCFRDAATYPSDVFALETALTWIHTVEHQEKGWLKILGAQLASHRALRAAGDILPVTGADAAVVGRHVQFFQDWIVHENPGDPWWDPVDFGRQVGSVPTASLVGGWYDIFLPAQLDDYTALRAAGRSATLTVGPWSHSSPGVMASSMRDGLKLFDGQFDQRPCEVTNNVVRLFVMGARRWVELAEWPPPFEEQTWYLGVGGKLQRSPSAGTTPDGTATTRRIQHPGSVGPRSAGATRGPRTSARERAELTSSATRARPSPRTLR
jgi:putative CocE/NonD family hydrolase